MNKEITSEKNYKYKHILKKYIPTIKYKRQSSFDREKLRLKKRNDSFKPGEAISHNTFLNLENSNAKTSLDILNTKRNGNKRLSFKKNFRNNSIKIGKSPSPQLKKKEKINQNLIKILENKEKAKTFNRKGSKQKLNMENKNNADKNLIIINNKINMPRVKSGAFQLNKQKLLNQKKYQMKILIILILKIKKFILIILKRINLKKAKIIIIGILIVLFNLKIMLKRKKIIKIRKKL